MTNIAVINHAKTPLGVDLGSLVAALQVYHDSYFAPVWKTQCLLSIAKKAPKGSWVFGFFDNADQAGALGYHDFVNGLPLAKIFVKTTIADGGLVSVTAAHELAEMLVDPSANKMVRAPKSKPWGGNLTPLEVADAVEEDTFPVAGVVMSNFVYPAWFESHAHPAGTKFDYLGTLKKPFTLRPGGYASIQKANGSWTQIWGSQAKRARWKKEDRRGHRNEELREGRR